MLADDGNDASHALSRRTLIRQGTAAAALLALSPSWSDRLHAAAVRDTRPGHDSAERPYLAAALRAERWIARSAMRDGGGLTWPADPVDPASVQNNLYSGSPGVVLFYLELHHATGDDVFLSHARAGADYLMASLPTEAAGLGDDGAGLYTGVAGVTYVLEMVRRATGDARYAAGVARGVKLLRDSLVPMGQGASWNPSTDIISGTGGILLLLAWLDRSGSDWSSWRRDAGRAGERLLEVATPEHGGLKWSISDSVPRRYPNFSHGTAGVSYVLATLYKETGDRRYLDAALAGERYLRTIATVTPNDGLKILHSEPGGEQLFYLSWCHGPAGTARLYQRLADVTGDAAWRANIGRLAQGIIDSGVPERHPDRSGYWNNISQCCGNCGISEFFLGLHQSTGDARHLTFARRVVDNTLARATEDGDGLQWIQAEHRVRPELLIAQTGLMQGAAGVGLALLHLDGTMEKRRALVSLPDTPRWS
ncbi:MAG: lanthionine synthetase LanC family protein [Gemmatimonadaceae bacterium]